MHIYKCLVCIATKQDHNVNSAIKQRYYVTHRYIVSQVNGSAVELGCHSDDVCTTGNSTTCLNGAQCRDRWNAFTCVCVKG